MTLRKNTASGSDVYEGAGYIKRTATGELNFKLYSANPIAPQEWIRGLSGQLVNKDEYYRLSVTDTRGRVWEAGGVLPRHEGWLNQKGYVIVGIIPSELRCANKMQWHITNAVLWMHFFDDLEIPCNTVTKSSSIIGDDQDNAIKQFDKNIAKFSSCGCDFTLSRKPGKFILGVSSNATELPANIENRVVESLQFVLANEVEPVIIERNERNVETVAIRPTLRPKPDCRLNPPLSFTKVQHAKEVWDLYSKYLSHILNYEGPTNWHPLSIFVHRVIHASAAYPETLSLEVAVAVEGILRLEFEQLSSWPREHREELSKAREIINQSNLPEDLKLRISGAINAMKHPSPPDKLRSLVKSGVIEEKEYKAWKKLRNRSTHPKRPHFSDLQEGFDLCDIVITLFYKLIFYAIGHRGKYTDYGVHGWPIREFSSYG